MSRSFDASRSRQRGDILIESLIGVLLMAIIGLGISYASSRASNSQQNMRLQNIAVSQMRDLLARYGKTLCTDSSLATITLPMQGSAVALDATCTTTPQVTIGTQTVESKTYLDKVVLTTRSSDNAIFGGVLRVGDET